MVSLSGRLRCPVFALLMALAMASLLSAQAPTPWYSLSDRSPGFGTGPRVGDVDGDGLDDLLVLTPAGSLAPGGQFVLGRVLLLSGRDGRALLNVGGETDFQGVEISAIALARPLGDVDGDGRADLLVNGRDVLSVMDDEILLSVENDGLAVLDDLDGDGWRDFVVVRRVLQGTVPNLEASLEVHIVSALAGRTGAFWRYPPAFAFVSVSSLGDLDGDHVPDVLSVAWPGSLNDAALIELRSGADGRRLDFRRGHPAGLITFVEPVDDMDADGRADVLVGLLSFASGPAAVVVSGYDLREILSFEDPFDSFSHVGDLTGDGVSDYIIGTMGVAPDPGRVDLFSGADNQLLFSIQGPAPAPGFGARVTALGDVHGDGVPDFAVTSRADVVGMPHSVSVFSGAARPSVDLAGGSPVTNLPANWADATVPPLLTAVGELLPASLLELRLTNGDPRGQGFLVAGPSVVTDPPPGLPWLVPEPLIVLPFVFDDQGVANWQVRWPADAPVGQRVVLQGWVVASDGEPEPLRASHALMLTGN